MRDKHSRKKIRVPKTRKRRSYRGGNTSGRCVFVYMINDEGLGNQLFCLSTGLVALNKIEREVGPNKMTLCIIPAGKNKHTANNYSHIFNFPPRVKVISESEGRPRMNAGEKVLTLSNQKPWAKWSNVNVKYNSSSGRNAVVPDRLYQNYLAVQSVIPTVKEMFMKNEFEHESKKSAYDNIKNTTPEGSAFIHVRRGDYVGRSWALDTDYYVRGMNELNKDPRIKKICIISNDLDWCKKIHWTTDKPIEYYDSKNELEVLYKMIVCSAGAVISSSTFSAWGAMMGVDLSPSKNADTKIVYPQNWLKHDDRNNPLLFPDIWTGIPNS